MQDAIKEKPTFDDEKKEMIYTLGGVLDKMGKKEESMEQYKMIYEVDSGYKDVADKSGEILFRRQWLPNLNPALNPNPNP